MISKTIVVKDDELGYVLGRITGVNHEGKLLASFNGEPSVVIHDDMIVNKKEFLQ